jgi:hypothetical protein
MATELGLTTLTSMLKFNPLAERASMLACKTILGDTSFSALFWTGLGSGGGTLVVPLQPTKPSRVTKTRQTSLRNILPTDRLDDLVTDSIFFIITLL